MALHAPWWRMPRRAFERVLLCLLSAALLAAVCADDPYEPDSTRQTAKPINPGETQSRRLCDADWASFTVQQDAVYAIETSNLTGGADTLLDVWECSWNSDGCNYYRSRSDRGLADGSRIVHRFSTGHPELGFGCGVDPFEFPQTAYAVVSQTDGGQGSDPSYALTLSCLSGCGELGAVSVLPVTASRQDLVTDLLLGNPGYVPRDVELVLSPTTQPGEGPSPRQRALVTVPAGATVLHEDVLASVLGLAEAGGALEIRPIGGDILAQATLRKPPSASTKGESVTPVIPLVDAASMPAAQHHLLLGTREGATARLVVAEVLGGPAEAIVRVYSTRGTILNTRGLTLPAHGQVELDLLRDLGVPPRPDVSATVEAIRGNLLTASVVTDLASGDVFVQDGRPSSALPARSGDQRVEVAVRTLQAATATPWFSIGDVKVQLGDRFMGANATWYLEDPLADLAPGSYGLLSAPSGQVIRARILSRSTEGSVGSSLPDVGRAATPINRPWGSARRALLIPPGARFLESHFEPEPAVVSPYDGRGALRESGSFQDLPTPPALVDLPLFAREPSEKPQRLEVEPFRSLDGASDSFRFVSVLTWPGSPDLAVLPGQTVNRSFDKLTVRVPGPAGDLLVVFRRVPPADFTMGSPDSERGRDGDEARRTVSVRRPYLLAETETTLALWRAVMGATPPALPPSFSGKDADTLPVVNVSWDEVAGPGGFLERLIALVSASGIAGVFRLPTEAEWERAARADACSAFGYLGSLSGCDLGCRPCEIPSPWYPFRCPWSIRYCGTSGDAGPRPVLPSSGNALGFRQMSGTSGSGSATGTARTLTNPRWIPQVPPTASPA